MAGANQLFGDPSRRAIVEHLREGKKNVTELVALTGLKQPNVSNHLAKLREEGLVQSERSGREVRYALSPGAAASISRLAYPTIEDAETVSPSALAGWSDRYFTALIEGDTQTARKVILEALHALVRFEDLCVSIIQPALYRIGDWYVKGRVSEAEEHAATALTERLLASASDAYVKKPSKGKLALLGSVEGNRHSLGLRMAADLLEIEGYTVRFLGADVPTKSFIKMMEAEQPDMLLISCATSNDIEAAVDLCESIRKSQIRPLLLTGGAAAGQFRSRLAKVSDAVCTSLADLLKAIS